jgi:hypothetical protein
LWHRFDHIPHVLRKSRFTSAGAVHSELAANLYQSSKG